MTKAKELWQNAKDNIRNYFKGVKTSEKIRETIRIFEKEELPRSINILKAQGREKEIPELIKMFENELLPLKEALKFYESLGL